MYQSLYRKWRPQTFSDMVGQESVVRTLKNQTQNGHIAHAYIFSGSRGTGKTSAARILAMAINCKNSSNGDPCLNCEACKSLLNESTLDVIEMDAASNSSVAEIRDMLEKVNYPPQFVPYKVYIIDEVHMLSNAAFNALLKTLEEPPKYMVFILATTEMQKIPATILSRCQRFEFGRIKEADIIGRLRLAMKSQIDADEEALQLIAFSADGSMRDAWSLMDMCLDDEGAVTQERVRQALGAVDRGFLFQFVNILSEKNPRAAFQMIQEMHASGRDVQVFFKDFSSHLRQLISSKLAGADQKNNRYHQQAAKLSLEDMTDMLEKSVRAQGDLRWVSQPRVVLEVFALRICANANESDKLSLQKRAGELENNPINLKEGKNISCFSKITPDLPFPVLEVESVQAKLDEEITKQLDPSDELISKYITNRVSEDLPAVFSQTQFSSLTGIPSVLSPKQIWNTMLERASREYPNIMGIMSEGKYGGFKEDRFYLTFEENQQLFIGMLMADERRTIIETMLSEISGKPTFFDAAREKRIIEKQDSKEKSDRDIQALSDLFGRQNIIVSGAEE